MRCPTCRSMYHRPPQTMPLSERAFALEVSRTPLLSAHQGGYPHHRDSDRPDRAPHIITPFGVVMAPQVAALYTYFLFRCD